MNSGEAWRTGGNPEDVCLAVLDELPSVTECRKALDMAVTLRRGVLVVGGKGWGKSAGLSVAIDAFHDNEKEMAELDPTHRIRRVVTVDNPRELSYRQTAIQVATTLSKRYSERVRGRKKDTAEIRADIIQMMLQSNVVVLLLDEAEHCSDDTLTFARDLLAASEMSAGARYSENGKRANGIGVILAGEQTLEDRIVHSAEAGERWVTSLRVPPLTIEEVTSLLDVWVPGTAEIVGSRGAKEWENYLKSLLWRPKPPSLRNLENVVRQYCLLLVRNGTAETMPLAAPFNQEMFEEALRDVSLGKGAKVSR